MLVYDFADRKDKTLYEFLYSSLKRDILNGRLAQGSKLPSKRALAKDNQISVRTVMNAYEQLLAEGFIVSEEKRGYFVAKVYEDDIRSIKNILGNRGIQVNDDLAIDFKVQTKQGTERIARAAFEFARKNGKKNVTIVTKANIVKLVDGNFIKVVREVGKEYPEIEIQERLVDAMCAKMLDPEFNKGIEVVVLPNLYGDIVTDVAAEHQGGLGTASSSNIGNKYALFEAIHGTAPYLMSHGRGHYADPSSLIRAMGQMLQHIGFGDRNDILEKAMDICTIEERKVVLTTFTEDASTKEFTDYLLETIQKIKEA